MIQDPMAEKHKDNGYNVECTHSGQKRRYGDTFREFTVKSDKPESEVKAYCTEHVRKCELTSEQYLSELRAGLSDFGDHFRSHYKFYKLGDDNYAYVITEPSTH
jgi:hypothetical protein